MQDRRIRCGQTVSDCPSCARQRGRIFGCPYGRVPRDNHSSRSRGAQQHTDQKGPAMVGRGAAAWFGGSLATGMSDVTSDLSALDSGGRWAVAVGFEGEVVCARFEDWDDNSRLESAAGAWTGPPAEDYTSSMSRAQYLAAVAAVRELIATGEVYQVNVCRTLSAPMPDPVSADVFALMARLRRGNPAPFGGCLRIPAAGIAIASASPELFLRRSGRVIESDPIKGTGRTAHDLTPKDRAENVMIVDLVRNDLGRVCETGTVEVPSLLRLEEHPGLTHLVSTVRGRLREGVGWAEIFSASFAPGSVTGAPKVSALRAIAAIEPVPRGPYCGAFGWVDADTQTAELAVAIRTFWLTGRDGDLRLHFGTGAGITWGSDPQAEWDETCLKAANLIRVASGTWSSGTGTGTPDPLDDRWT